MREREARGVVSMFGCLIGEVGARGGNPSSGESRTCQGAMTEEISSICQVNWKDSV